MHQVIDVQLKSIIMPFQKGEESYPEQKLKYCPFSDQTWLEIWKKASFYWEIQVVSGNCLRVWRIFLALLVTPEEEIC